MDESIINIENKPLFSVMMASYNNAQYIENALKSVFAQSYTKWEIIIVDDGSTDNSDEVYEKYKTENRIKIFFNKKNEGVGFTKRKCIELAEGELCGFLDTDDLLTENALEIMVNLHKVKPNCSLIYSTFFIYQGENDIKPAWDYIGKIDENEDLLISSKNMVSHFATFKKSFYLKTLGIDISLLSAEDKDLYLKLEEVGDLYYQNEPLYYYRVDNENSVSRGSVEKVRIANYYLSLTHLRAFKRRITGNSSLYRKNKLLYLSYMYRNLKLYNENRKSLSLFFIFDYVFLYLKFSNYSIRSFINVIKLNKLVTKFLLFYSK
ncbi:MAG: glycosyltransferase [Bacteroidota bacterium]